MSDERHQDTRIPLVEERLVVDRRIQETGRVRIRTIVDHEQVLFKEELSYQQVLVDRVEINQDIDVAPEVRQDGDLLIIPVVEEYLFVEKRLRLKEELHVRMVHGVDRVADTIPVRRMRAVVERQAGGGDAYSTGDDPNANDHRPLR
jgi:stress response protein YsnF